MGQQQVNLPWWITEIVENPAAHAEKAELLERVLQRFPRRGRDALRDVLNGESASRAAFRVGMSTAWIFGICEQFEAEMRDDFIEAGLLDPAQLDRELADEIEAEELAAMNVLEPKPRSAMDTQSLIGKNDLFLSNAPAGQTQVLAPAPASTMKLEEVVCFSEMVDELRSQQRLGWFCVNPRAWLRRKSASFALAMLMGCGMLIISVAAMLVFTGSATVLSVGSLLIIGVVIVYLSNRWIERRQRRPF